MVSGGVADGTDDAVESDLCGHGSRRGGVTDADGAGGTKAGGVDVGSTGSIADTSEIELPREDVGWTGVGLAIRKGECAGRGVEG